MDLDHRSDEELLTARTGPHAGAAYAALYRRHERLILAFHLRRVGDPDIAKDLAAETFAQALASRSRYADQGPGSGARWLYGIAGNVLAYSARKAAGERRKCAELRIQIPPLDARQRSEIESLQSEDTVESMLSVLPAEQRDAVRAFVLEERSYPEIAAEAGKSEATMRKRVSRGLSALRRNTEGARS